MGRIGLGGLILGKSVGWIHLILNGVTINGNYDFEAKSRGEPRMYPGLPDNFEDGLVEF